MNSFGDKRIWHVIAAVAVAPVADVTFIPDPEP